VLLCTFAWQLSREDFVCEKPPLLFGCLVWLLTPFVVDVAQNVHLQCEQAILQAIILPLPLNLR
jgi:hypothetical protein